MNKLKHTLHGHSDSVNFANFTCEKTKVVSGSNDRTFKIWDINNGSCFKTVNTASAVKCSEVF
jgi:WD40 repeat protein